jgi:hypothetical protein
MPAYAYPITIKRERQKVRYSKTIELDDHVLTLGILSKLVTPDERFCIVETDEGLYSRTILSISGFRLETDEELADRVKKEESYMIEYNKRHKK